MKQKTFTLRDENVFKTMIAFIEAQPKGILIEAVIREHKKDRSLRQNSLYWEWVTVISNELGMTKEDQHEDLKKRILVPIYERDDLGYAAMIQAIRRVYSQGLKDDANAMFEHIVRLTSTTNAKVKQFTEYLKEIERDMIGKGIALPHPEDRYYQAMGIKQS